MYKNRVSGLGLGDGLRKLGKACKIRHRYATVYPFPEERPAVLMPQAIADLVRHAIQSAQEKGALPAFERAINEIGA